MVNTNSVAFEHMARRLDAAEDSFIEFAVSVGLTVEGARAALAVYVKRRLIKLDAVGGQFYIKHGAYLDADVLARAAEMGA